MEILAQMAAINGYTDCLTEEEQRVYCTALEKLCNRLNELKEENDA